jgi:hypothetical protein
MSTATITYQVASNQVSQIKSAVLDIIYIDQNGVTQRIPGYSSATGAWSLTFTGTVGQPYSLSAVEVQGGANQNDQQFGQGVTVSVVDSNGPTTVTANNFSNTSLRAGVTGTI